MTTATAEIAIRCKGSDYLPLDALTPLQGDLKSLTKEAAGKLKQSMLAHGFLFPFFVWKAEGKNYYIDGTQRDRVLRMMAREGTPLPDKFPVVYIDAKDKKDAAQIILLQSSTYGKLSDESLADYVLAQGIDFEAMRDILDLPNVDLSKEVVLRDGNTGEDEVPVDVESRTKPGDLWKMGPHRLICGDSTEKDVIERLMGGDRATCVFTDPPYGVAIGAKNRFLNSFQKAGRNLKDIEDDALSPDDLKAVLLPAFLNIREMVMADDATLFMTAPQGGELCMMMMMMMKDAGLPARHVLIWKKNAPTFSMGRLDYDYQHEPILLTWGKRHKRPMRGQHKTSVWEVAKPMASKEHPTMKPVELYINAYLNNSDDGDVVFDAYSGSGTMFIAAERTGRVARGVELDPHYCDVILKRWEEFTGNKATK